MGLNKIRASNGNGEAVRASVSAFRAQGSTILKLDALTNYPEDFIATSGTLLSNDTLDPESVTVFFGHISGSDVIIDGYAPGYSDIGHTASQVVLIKPTTAWADYIADFLSVAHTDEGTISQVGGGDGLKFLVSDTQPSPEPGTIILWFEPQE